MIFPSRSASTRTSLVFSCILAAVMALLLFGCGRTEEPTPSNGTNPPVNSADKGSGTTPIADSEFKVALVMSGPKSDNGWNAGAAKALDAVKTELKLADDNVKSVDNQKTAGDQ